MAVGSTKPMTSRQAKQAYKDRGGVAQLTELQRRQLDRRIELQARADAIRERNERRKENQRKKELRDAKTAEMRRKQGLPPVPEPKVSTSQPRILTFLDGNGRNTLQQPADGRTELEGQGENHTEHDEYEHGGEALGVTTPGTSAKASEPSSAKVEAGEHAPFWDKVRSHAIERTVGPLNHDETRHLAPSEHDDTAAPTRVVVPDATTARSRQSQEQPTDDIRSAAIENHPPSQDRCITIGTRHAGESHMVHLGASLQRDCTSVSSGHPAQNVTDRDTAILMQGSLSDNGDLPGTHDDADWFGGYGSVNHPSLPSTLLTQLEAEAAAEDLADWFPNDSQVHFGSEPQCVRSTADCGDGTGQHRRSPSSHLERTRVEPGQCKEPPGQMLDDLVLAAMLPSDSQAITGQQASAEQQLTLDPEAGTIPTVDGIDDGVAVNQGSPEARARCSTSHPSLAQHLMLVSDNTRRLDLEGDAISSTEPYTLGGPGSADDDIAFSLDLTPGEVAQLEAQACRAMGVDRVSTLAQPVWCPAAAEPMSDFGELELSTQDLMALP